MKNQWLLIVLIVAIFFGSSTICRSSALLKYKDIRLNAGQIERLAEHDHLIRYYCENLLLYGEENSINLVWNGLLEN